MTYLSFFRFSPNKFLVAIVAGLLVVSYLLYMVDVWATERIDGLLLAHYGPELYERYTSALQEVRTDKVAKIWALENLQGPLELEPEPQWTAEDEVRRSQTIFGEVFTFVYLIWFLSWQISLLSISAICLTTVIITFLKLVNTLSSPRWSRLIWLRRSSSTEASSCPQEGQFCVCWTLHLHDCTSLFVCIISLFKVWHQRPIQRWGPIQSSAQIQQKGIVVIRSLITSELSSIFVHLISHGLKEQWRHYESKHEREL